MSEKLVIAAQLSSVHSSIENLEPNSVINYINKVVKEIPIDILILGWEEKPALFNALSSKKNRLTKEVFLWYPFLSDYPEVDSTHLVVNINSDKSAGWDGYAGTGINETFKQSCPNNPEAVNISLKHLEYLLSKYDFDGVFVDKIRFPSAANGLQDVFSCFCPHCIENASKAGLDLNDVKQLLKTKKWTKNDPDVVFELPPGGNWLEALIQDYSLIKQFIRFRADSVNAVITLIANQLKKMHKKMSLDVFSPGLAPLVGQDFLYMGQFVDWVKPMIYRFGNGPSSLRSEIPALIRELANYLGLNQSEVMAWTGEHIEGLGGVPLEEIEKVAPLSLLRAETKKAVEIFKNTPVYLGLETVSIPGVMNISPRNVEEILVIGAEADVQGYVLSWDLLHTPIENVLPLKTFIV